MNAIVDALRWIVCFPLAYICSEVIGTILAYGCWFLRHIGGKLIGDRIDVLQRPLAMVSFFFVGYSFVCIGRWTAPNYKVASAFALLLIKFTIDWQRASFRRLTHDGPDWNSSSATVGALVAAFESWGAP